MFKPSEFWQRFEMCQKSNDFLIHLLIGKTKIDYILYERQEKHIGRHAVCFLNMSEESKANFIGKHWNVLILEHFARFHYFFFESCVLFVEIGENLPKLFSEDYVLVHHLNII